MLSDRIIQNSYSLADAFPLFAVCVLSTAKWKIQHWLTLLDWYIITTTCPMPLAIIKHSAKFDGLFRDAKSLPGYQHLGTMAQNDEHYSCRTCHLEREISACSYILIEIEPTVKGTAELTGEMTPASTKVGLRSIARV